MGSDVENKLIEKLKAGVKLDHEDISKLLGYILEELRTIKNDIEYLKETDNDLHKHQMEMNDLTHDIEKVLLERIEIVEKKVGDLINANQS